MSDSPFAVEEAYSPPQTDSHPVCVFRTNFGANEYGAFREAGGWMFRRIRFYGAYEGVVEWNAVGGWEKVTIDGQVGQSYFNWGAHLVYPRFEFPVEAGYPATMTVEIRLRYVFLVGAFRIRLDGRTLYSEGDWPDEPLPRKPR
jgi:hypothetical protein